MTTRLSCTCGAVHIEVEKKPIISAECHCASCREAAARLATLPAAPPVTSPNGGVRFVLYRKDRVRIVEGGEQLRQFRLKPSSGTRRIVAACCNTPAFLEFEAGHWLSIYSGLWPQNALPPIDIRTMTGDLPDAAALDQTVPSGAWHTAGFYARLLGAWIAMGFRSPKLTVTGAIDA